MKHTLEELVRSLEAYYPLNKHTKDYSGKEKNATAVSTVTYSPGPQGSGSGANFDTTGTAISLPDSFISNPQDYTLSVWAKINSYDPVEGEQNDEGVIVGLLGIARNTGAVRFHFQYDDNGTIKEILLESTASIRLNDWTHICITFKHSTKECLIYIDGEADTSKKLDIPDNAKAIMPASNSIGANITDEANKRNTLNGSVSDVSLLWIPLEQCCVQVFGGYSYAAIPPDDDENPLWFVIAIIVIAVAYIVEYAILTKEVKEQQSSEPLPEQDPQSISNRIRAAVGEPARSGVKVTRGQVAILSSTNISIDVGGMGVYHHVNDESIAGLPNTLNMADKRENPDTRHEDEKKIPNLVLVQDWTTDPTYPFADNFADYITMQNAPLTDTNVTEMARVLKPDGQIGLWIDVAAFRQNIDKLKNLLGPEYEEIDCTGGNRYYDEMHDGFRPSKILLARKQPFLG